MSKQSQTVSLSDDHWTAGLKALPETVRGEYEANYRYTSSLSSLVEIMVDILCDPTRWCARC
jgi:hypothetical protein